MCFNKEFLQEKCINSFVNDGIIFTNESQFQFALAMKIKETLPDSTVYLEQPIFLKNKSKDNIIEKMYIDIVVKYNDKLYPIELKYKTTNKELVYSDSVNNYYTFNQGAADCGSFDFVWDIKRIERLVFEQGLEDTHIKWSRGEIIQTNKKNIKIDYTTLGEKPDFGRGFVIMITNNKSYYGKKRTEQLYWKNFILEDGTIGGTLNWANDTEELSDYQKANKSDDWKKIKNACGLSRCKPICLKGSYKLEWKEYTPANIDFNKKPQFKYVIVEVKELEYKSPVNDL
ncbi:MAG: hypothetical protein E7517_01535 [Ruminococcaceae bacterium]|nr:hypothetical protein [Oscillospiraceae bacterium]